MTTFSEDEKRLDPEFTALQESFAQREVPATGNLSARTRWLAVLAALLGCQGVEEFENVLPQALDEALTPVEVKEVVYQATAYLGMGRVRPFLGVTNCVLTARGVELPLEPQGTTSPDDRRERGTEAQVELFGPQMADFWTKGDINRFLAANCFGDHYTRGGLDLTDRELVTFCYLVAQGGCEPQATSHARANIARGNDAQLLTDVISQLVPYIGYPRSLNGLSCVAAASETH